MQDEKRMVITFWRPSRWDRSIFDKETCGPVEQGRFLEEVYTWEPAEFIWNSIEETEIRTQLSESLLDNFSPDKQPEERGIKEFRNVLEQVEKLIAEGKGKWSDCKTEDVQGDEIALRANLLLSFLHNLTWLCDIFMAVPGISVTVR